MVNPAPALNPVSTLSLISLTRTLSRNSHAIRQAKPTPKAAAEAIWAYRAISSPAMLPTAPAIISEIADVGPTARKRDDPASA